MENNSTESFQSISRAGKIKYKAELAVRSLLSIPKTLYFNFRCFPLKEAVRLPVLVAYDTKLIELHRNIIKFSSVPKSFGVKIGFGGSDGIIERKNSICLEKGQLLFEGKATFAKGASIRVMGEMRIGDDFFSNRNCTLWCSNRISIGSSVLFGWNITLRDHDGHLIIQDGMPKEITKPITIGDHSWICSETHMLKGARIGTDCVVGYKSLVTKAFNENNVLIAGSPAKIVSENIEWKR